MKSSSQPIIEFNPKLPKLSKNEREVLKLLTEAGRLISPVYEAQIRDINKDLNTEDLEKAAEKNPQILSPYTVIEQVNGGIVAIPYHEKYAKLLEPIIEKLEKAASISDNQKFSKALKIQAKALQRGTYEEAIAAWITLEPYIIDLSIGPIEYHSAKLPFAKAYYHAWVGVLDKEGTGRLNRYKTITLSTRRKALLAQGRVDNLDRVKAKTIDVILFAGSIAQIKFVGVNLPIDVRIVEKYGSEITIINQSNDLRMKEQILPIFNKIFPKLFQEGFNTEDLRRGSLRYIAMHEIAHSYLYYSQARENLQDFFSPIYELAATVLGLRLAGTLLLEDVITDKQLESMIIAYICRSFYLMEENKSVKYLASPVLASTIFINFLFESGALKQKAKLVIPNFMKIFVSLQELLYILERLLAVGTRRDAEVFLGKYAKIK